jgi:hypothetical protein
MTGKTTKTGRIIMTVVAVLVGIFMMFSAPFISMKALTPALHNLIETHQVQQPNGVWDTPVGILTATFHVWIALFVFGGAALVVIAKDIYADKKWARPVALSLLALPSIGGMTMVIPWMVLVMQDALGNKIPDAGMPAAMPIMVIGLIGYFIILLTEKAEAKTKIAQAVTFGALGIVGGMVFMNAQHGVRHFLTKAPFYEASESNPELFLGGFVMYAAVALFFVAIWLMAARKESGWYFGVITGIVTFVAAFLAFVDRYNVPSGQEWLRGAMLSAVLIAILVIPWFKNKIFNGK